MALTGKDSAGSRHRGGHATKTGPLVDWTDPAVRDDAYARFLDLLDTVYHPTTESEPT